MVTAVVIWLGTIYLRLVRLIGFPPPEHYHDDENDDGADADVVYYVVNKTPHTEANEDGDGGTYYATYNGSDYVRGGVDVA